MALTWDDPGDASITGYRILRRNRETDPYGQFQTIDDDTGSAATSYTDNTVATDTRYVYRVKAINGAGLSERSNHVRADNVKDSAPARPTGLSATASRDAATLTWDDPGDGSITGYRILRRNRDTDAVGEFTVVNSDTGSAATTYTDETVEPGNRYAYRVKAINADGSSEPSDFVRADTRD